MAEIKHIDAGRATALARNWLEQNYGNLGLLLFRVEDVTLNGTPDTYFVLCSLLTSLGSLERTYYLFKIDTKTASLKEVKKGKLDEKGKFQTNEMLYQERKK